VRGILDNCFMTEQLGKAVHFIEQTKPQSARLLLIAKTSKSCVPFPYSLRT
jgi:hypothetical protein